MEIRQDFDAQSRCVPERNGVSRYVGYCNPGIPIGIPDSADNAVTIRGGSFRVSYQKYDWDIHEPAGGTQ